MEQLVTTDRWGNHPEDRVTYDFIWDVAMKAMDETPEECILLLSVINEWEKDRRSVPQSVISKAYDVAKMYQEIMDADPDVDQALKEILSQPGPS